jgi:hypothetical protein
MSHLGEKRRRGRGRRAAATGAAVLSLLAGTTLLVGMAAPSASASVTTPCGSVGVYSAAGTTATCTYTGAGTEDTFAVPSGVTNLHVTAIGGPGGSGAASGNPGLGGKGAVVTNPALVVQPGATLYVDVGAPGANNTNNESLCPSNAPGGSRDGGVGGAGCGNDFGGGGGGGSTDLSTAPLTGADKVTPTGSAQDPRLIVAGGGGGAGSSYLGLKVPGDPAPSTISTAASQTPSMAITWSLIKLVFTGRFSADINGSIVAGGLKITSFEGLAVSVTGRLVIQTANGDTFRVSVRIAGLFGRYSGQISVSGPGVRTTAIVSTRNLAISDGLVTGEGRGFNGFAPYSLSFTL